MGKRETVYVGVSGGVDSSVSLLRLKKSGYNVVAVFIKTWQPDFVECTWKQDRLDAMRVSATLDVPFITFDAEQAYKENVADYMIHEYKAGRTPNPDVMCNESVKFGVFYDFAMASGADRVATGHYAQIKTVGDAFELHRGVDGNKDQSYFLWRLRGAQLSHILFPVGDSHKPTIRREATKAMLPTHAKHDSQGICFLGQVDIKDFLSHYIDNRPGDVLTTDGTIVGTHEGAFFYTIGQRHGFKIHTTDDNLLPYYVVSKDIEKNVLMVDHAPRTCTNTIITLSSVNTLIDTLPEYMEAEFRYRQTPFRVQHVKSNEGHDMLKVLDTNIEVPSVGQSCVLYSGTRCLGGGVINTVI